MCLTADINKTKAFLKENKKVRKIKAYKVLNFRKTKKGEKELVAPYKGSKYLPGTVYARNKYRHKFNAKLILDDFTQVSYGIHVYLDIESALRIAIAYTSRIVVEVTCETKDLIAVGESGSLKSAVFSKVFLTKKEYNKALRSVYLFL